MLTMLTLTKGHLSNMDKIGLSSSQHLAKLFPAAAQSCKFCFIKKEKEEIGQLYVHLFLYVRNNCEMACLAQLSL